MPIYEYECADGHRFEELRSIEERYNSVCPVCNEPVHILISLQSKHLVAHPFTVLAHDGTVLSSTQTTERTSLKIRKKSGKVVNA